MLFQKKFFFSGKTPPPCYHFPPLFFPQFFPPFLLFSWSHITSSQKVTTICLFYRLESIKLRSSWLLLFITAATSVAAADLSPVMTLVAGSPFIVLQHSLRGVSMFPQIGSVGNTDSSIHWGLFTTLWARVCLSPAWLRSLRLHPSHRPSQSLRAHWPLLSLPTAQQTKGISISQPPAQLV